MMLISNRVNLCLIADGISSEVSETEVTDSDDEDYRTQQDQREEGVRSRKRRALAQKYSRRGRTDTDKKVCQCVIDSERWLPFTSTNNASYSIASVCTCGGGGGRSCTCGIRKYIYLSCTSYIEVAAPNIG